MGQSEYNPPHRNQGGLTIENSISPETQYDRLTRALGWALLAYSGMRVFTVARGVTSLVARGVASRAPHASTFGTALLTSNTIISYVAIVAFIALVVWVAFGLLKQRPTAARAVHVLLPVLLALTALSVLRELTSGWLQYVVPSPSRPLTPQPWIGQAATGLEFAVMLWAAMIYRRLSASPASEGEWRGRAAWALSVPSLVSWAWIIYSAQALQRTAISLALNVGMGSMPPYSLGASALRALPYGVVAFFMVRDGLRVLERDREALQRLANWILAVLIVSIAVAVYVGFIWTGAILANLGDAGSGLWYAILSYVSAISRWIVLPVVSLLMLRKWQRPVSLHLGELRAGAEGRAGEQGSDAGV